MLKSEAVTTNEWAMGKVTLCHSLGAFFSASAVLCSHCFASLVDARPQKRRFFLP